MKITITNCEAARLAHEQLHQLIGQDVAIDITVDPSFDRGENRVTAANKSELINFARQVFEDTLSGNIVPAKGADVKLFFGLADAKRYVEKYFNFPN